MARLVRLEQAGNLYELDLEVGREVAGDAADGDSVALDGCCLTVVGRGESTLRFQAVPETLQKTTLGDRRVGDSINIERALRADARLGGHFVLGHIDGTGSVRAVERDGDDVRIEVSCSADISRYIVPKGSVAIDGVSLTVVEAKPDGFSVALIPHTLAITTLGQRSAGDSVNLEVDVIGKYVVRYLDELGLSPTPSS
jgi:riboflavin synthase alpha subunit